MTSDLEENIRENPIFWRLKSPTGEYYNFKNYKSIEINVRKNYTELYKKYLISLAITFDSITHQFGAIIGFLVLALGYDYVQSDSPNIIYTAGNLNEKLQEYGGDGTIVNLAPYIWNDDEKEFIKYAPEEGKFKNIKELIPQGTEVSFEGMAGIIIAYYMIEYELVYYIKGDDGGEYEIPSSEIKTEGKRRKKEF